MKTRKLGNGNLEVSALDLGYMRTSHDEDPLPDKGEMTTFFYKAVERGINFFDTAKVYGPFINKELFGEALELHKGEVMIATKFGFKCSDDGMVRPQLGLDSWKRWRTRCRI